jgi:outer membrane protein
LNKNFIVLPAFLLGIAVVANAQTAAPARIGIIHAQAAILGTKDGQKAAADVNTKFAPRQAELEKKKSSIEAKEDQLRKGQATLSEDNKTTLMRDIDQGKKALQRDSEDAQADLEQEENKVYNELGSKLYAVVDKYAKENGFALIVDVSPQTQPVFWAADAVNITNEIVKLYDKAYPEGSSAAPSTTSKGPVAPTARPTAPPPAAAPAAPKKQ